MGEWVGMESGHLPSGCSESLQGIVLDRLAPTHHQFLLKGQVEGTALPFKEPTWRQHIPLWPGFRHMVTAGETGKYSSSLGSHIPTETWGLLLLKGRRGRWTQEPVYSLLVAVSVPYCPALPDPDPSLQMEARLKLGRSTQMLG